MKKFLCALLTVPLTALGLFGEELADAVGGDFGFDFVGVLTDVRDTTRELDFSLSTTNRSDVPVWGRRIPVAVASNGRFNVRLADAAGQPLHSLETNLVRAVARIGGESLRLTVRDGSGAFSVALPPVEIAGVAEKAMGASGDFNAAKGLVVPELTTSDISAGRVIAESLSVQTAVKAADALVVSGGLEAKGALRNEGLTTVKTLTVRDAAMVAADLETKQALSVGSVAGVKKLAVEKTLTVGGVNVGVPAGTIVAWNDASRIPAGWAICNGDNGTPNMRNRFVVGAGSGYVPGDAKRGYGGADSVQLTMGQMPSHSHVLPYYTGKNVSPYRKLREVRGVSTEYPMTGSRSTDAACGPATGSGTLGDAHENRPPYYALVFIMKKYGGTK